MEKSSRPALPRRQAIARVVQAGISLTFLEAGRQEAAAQDSPEKPLATPSSPPPTAPPLDPRQTDVRSIRQQAAEQGSKDSGNFHVAAEGDDYLRQTQFSKVLRRDTKNDINLADPAGFSALRKALDDAYARTFDPQRTGFPDAPDFIAIEALAPYIGKSGATDETTFKFTNPLGGLAFELEGIDPALSKMKEAPSFESAETAAEMAEIYWMALLRDVSFAEFDPAKPSQRVLDAVADLNKFSWFKPGSPPHTTQGKIKAARFLRATLTDPDNPGFKGVDVGPFLSQFLLRGTRDPGACTPLGGPERGVVNFGTLRLSQRQRTVLPGVDYLQTNDPSKLYKGLDQWYNVQNGSRNNIGFDAADETDLRFIRTLRDGSNYVHFDEIYQEYLIAASILLASIPRVGNTKEIPANTSQYGITAHVSESEGASASLLNYGNPYRTAKTQVGFATFGLTQTLALLAEVSDRAHKAGWYHKWRIRRLRPEEYGARVDSTVKGLTNYKLHPDLLNAFGGDGNSDILKRICEFNYDALTPVFPSDFELYKRISYLLPMAFPEGCPTHPAYPSGHATVAGASTTVLKAIFNETAPLTHNPTKPGDNLPSILQPDENGLSLKPYEDPNNENLVLTVGGELHKLASNITAFRGMAGVHWRSDNTQGMLLGEQIAIEILHEQTIASKASTTSVPFYRERWYDPNKPGDKTGQSPFFRLTMFNGSAIDIVDGTIYPVEFNGNPDDQTKWVRDTAHPMTYEAFRKEHYNF